ncbi:MAG: DUF58 domain-containing protein [Halothiobacillus sp.]
MKPPFISQHTLKPNKIGVGFIILAIAMLLAAINYGNNLVFFISFLLIALMGNSAWQTHRQLKGCDIAVRSIAARYAPRPGSWAIKLDSKLQNPAITLCTEGAEPLVLAVSAGKSILVNLPLPALPRGRHPAPTIILSTHYPIGLWTAEKCWNFPTHPQWVYPEPRGDAPLPHSVHPTGKAEPQAALFGGDEYFDHLRAYVAGDNLSRIAFKHFAKTGQLVTQHWENEHRNSGEIRIDFNELSGNLEEKLQQITQWILWLSAKQTPFTLLLPGQAEMSGTDATHQKNCLEALASFRAPVSPSNRGNS